MLAAATSLIRALGLDPTAIYRHLSRASLMAALRQQGLGELHASLAGIVGDLSDQYSLSHDGDEYWETKIRALHAFQVSSLLGAVDGIAGDDLTIADVGDSSGNHARYLKALAPAGKVGRVIGINMDPVAIDKIRARGGEAVMSRAEDLDHHDIRPDLWVSFETLEHLSDPVRFLHGLAAKGSAKYLLVSVPFCRRSRFGGSHLRTAQAAMAATMTPEEVHLFELSPDDWALLARFAGFKTRWRRIYLQYPRWHPLWLTLPLWRKLDFEGFVTLFLERDLGVADRYTGW